MQGSFASHTMSITAWLELVASGLITGGIYALVALGYSDKEAALAVKALPRDVGVSEGIKLALKSLAK